MVRNCEEKRAVSNYCKYPGLPHMSATIDQVHCSALGVQGWGDYNGQGAYKFSENPISNREPRSEIVRRKALSPR